MSIRPLPRFDEVQPLKKKRAIDPGLLEVLRGISAQREQIAEIMKRLDTLEKKPPPAAPEVHNHNQITLPKDSIHVVAEAAKASNVTLPPMEVHNHVAAPEVMQAPRGPASITITHPDGRQTTARIEPD